MDDCARGQSRPTLVRVSIWGRKMLGKGLFDTNYDVGGSMFRRLGYLRRSQTVLESVMRALTGMESKRRKLRLRYLGAIEHQSEQSQVSRRGTLAQIVSMPRFRPLLIARSVYNIARSQVARGKFAISCPTIHQHYDFRYHIRNTTIELHLAVPPS